MDWYRVNNCANELPACCSRWPWIRLSSTAIPISFPAVNANAIRALLAGETGAYRDVVLFNAAASLMVADKVSDLKDGVAMAAESVDSGRAKAALDTLVEITNRPQ